MLIDTNVLLDDALNRHPHSADSKEFLRRVEQTTTNAFVAWHTMSNLYYIASRERGDELARQFILVLIGYAEIAETTTEHLRYAASLEMRDFEDATQAAAVRACGALHIVTRHIRDFADSPIPAFTPRDALTGIFWLVDREK